MLPFTYAFTARIALPTFITVVSLLCISTPTTLL